MKKYDFNLSANDYDNYYKTEFGKNVDKIEKNCISRFLEKIPKTEVLEIGSGTGHWTEFFSKKGYSITGIDIANQMLEKAKKKNIPYAKFLKADVLNLPFDEQSFNAVFAVTSLEFTENQQKAFDEIYRVLKNNGHLLIGGLLAESELYENRLNSQTFKNADFFTIEKLNNLLNKFGKPEFKTCLNIVNGKIISSSENIKPAFVVVYVKKQYF